MTISNASDPVGLYYGFGFFVRCGEAKRGLMQIPLDK